MVAPSEWKDIRLGDAATIARGGSPRPIQDYLTTNPDGINWVKIGDVEPGAKYIIRTSERIIKEGRAKSRDVHVGDLILSNSMSYGRPYILKIDGCIHDGWLVIQEYGKVFDQDYLYYALSSWETIKQYHAMSAGSGVQNLSKDKVANVLIRTPNHQEQEAIASALDAIELLVTTMEETVSKKRNIREGIAQSLLTGSIRLPGYEGGWKRIELQEALSFCTAMIPTESIDIGDYIGTENMLKDRGGVAINTKPLPYTRVREYLSGDILVSNIRPYLKKIWYAMHDGGCSNDVLVLRSVDKRRYDPAYCFLLLSRDDFFSYATNNSSGTKMPRGDKDAIKRYLFRVPENIDEQRAIAEVLMTVDRELEDLKRKLEKYKQIKQGMMRELLIGRIRLVQE